MEYKVRSVECGVELCAAISVKFKGRLWNAVWSVKCSIWNVDLDCEVEKGRVFSAECARVECGVQVWSAKCGV